MHTIRYSSVFTIIQYCKFIHARNTFKLIMTYRFLLPEINILCLMSYVYIMSKV
jgi:hypothetical protein